MTRLKLFVLHVAVLLIGAGVTLWQFQASINRPTFGNTNFQQGWFGETWRGLVVGAFPGLGAAIAAYFVLKWLLFRRGEIEDYEAARRLAKAKQSLSAAAAVEPPPATQVAHSRFAEECLGDTKNIVEDADTVAMQAPYLGNLVDSSGVGRRLRYKGEKHLLSFGMPGSGKSTSLVVPNLAALRRSMIVIDPKAQLAAITARQRARMGRVIVLNPFGLLADELPHLESAGWNPLKQIDTASFNFESDARCIAQAMCGSSTSDGGKSEFFETSQENLLTVCAMWERQRRGDKASLRAVRELVAQPLAELKAMFKDMSESDNYAMRVAGSRAYARLTDSGSQSTSLQDVIETVMKSTAFLNDDRIGADMHFGGGIDFAALHREITTIYVILPVDQLLKQGKWLRLFVNVAMSELLKAPPRVATLPPILFMLDEFGNLGRLPEILNVLNIARDLRIQLWMFLQNLEQLKRAYKEESTYFFAGSGVVTTFDTGDDETAQLFSKMLGKREVEMSSQSASGGIDFKRFQTSESTSTQVFDLMPPEDFRRMGKGNMVAFIEPSRFPARSFAGGYWTGKNADFFDASKLDPNPYRLS